MTHDRIAKIKGLMQDKTNQSNRALPSFWKPASLICRITSEPHTKAWLNTPNSLTKKLRVPCPTLTVEVLSETLDRPLLDEAKALAIHPQESAWIRCVVLKCGDDNWIYARTIIPNFTQTNPWYTLQNLGTKPLGDVLFELPSIKRTEFEFSKQRLKTWPHLNKHLNAQQTNMTGYARRSIFRQQDAPLLLTEVFLPNLLDLNIGISDDR